MYQSVSFPLNAAVGRIYFSKNKPSFSATCGVESLQSPSPLWGSAQSLWTNSRSVFWTADGEPVGSFSCCIYKENESFTGLSGWRCLSLIWKCVSITVVWTNGTGTGGWVLLFSLLLFFFFLVARPKLNVHWGLSRFLGTAVTWLKGKRRRNFYILTDSTLFAACVSIQQCIEPSFVQDPYFVLNKYIFWGGVGFWWRHVNRTHILKSESHFLKSWTNI